MSKISNLPSITLSGKSFLASYDCFSVYAWLRRTEWLYVGLSTSIYQRLFTHDIINIKEYVKSTDRIVIWKCSSKEEMIAFEKQLIQKHNPKYNINYNANKELFESLDTKNMVQQYFHLKKVLPIKSVDKYILSIKDKYEDQQLIKLEQKQKEMRARHSFIIKNKG